MKLNLNLYTIAFNADTDIGCLMHCFQLYIIYSFIFSFTDDLAVWSEYHAMTAFN